MADLSPKSPRASISQPPLIVWVLLCYCKLAAQSPDSIEQKNGCGLNGVFHTYEKAIQRVHSCVQTLDRESEVPRGTFAEQLDGSHDEPIDGVVYKARWRTLEGDVFLFIIKQIVVV
ncbi:hypothetical protein MMC17_003082 [Xylographa soralifera]|nr:hypothetical protein [Xylographa soralifera]